MRAIRATCGIRESPVSVRLCVTVLLSKKKPTKNPSFQFGFIYIFIIIMPCFSPVWLFVALSIGRCFRDGFFHLMTVCVFSRLPQIGCMPTENVCNFLFARVDMLMNAHVMFVNVKFNRRSMSQTDRVVEDKKFSCLLSAHLDDA